MKKETNTTEDVREVVIHYRRTIDCKAKIKPTSEWYIEKRLREFSRDELILAIDNFSKDKWLMRHHSRNGIGWFFEDEDRIEKWLNRDSSESRRTIKI